jgi:hypothetical protein
MRQSFITQYFDAARASSTPAALEVALKAAQGTLTQREYSLLVARLIVAARSPLVEGELATQWQYPLLVGRLSPTSAGDTDPSPAGG